MTPTEKTLQRIREAQRAVAEELSLRLAGRQTTGTLDELTVIQKTLAEMEIRVTTSTVPSKVLRGRGMGRMISDSWPLASPLGTLVLEAEEAYVRL
jgi:hypothetical protein